MEVSGARRPKREGYMSVAPRPRRKHVKRHEPKLGVSSKHEKTHHAMQSRKGTKWSSPTPQKDPKTPKKKKPPLQNKNGGPRDKNRDDNNRGYRI
jgi:hypothetical protein